MDLETTTKQLKKQRTYKLRGVSYMSLSLKYIIMILVFAVCMILSVGKFGTSGNYTLMIIALIFFGALTYLTFRIGTKYGEYGLEIMIAKLLQKKHFKNDFRTIEKKLLGNQYIKDYSKKD